MRKRRISRRSQLITIGLLALFGLTAGGLMTLQDQHNSSLLDDEEHLNLEQPRQNAEKSHRWNSVLPRSTSLRD